VKSAVPALPGDCGRQFSGFASEVRHARLLPASTRPVTLLLAAVEWRWRKPAETSESETPRQDVMEHHLQVGNCDKRSYAVAEGTRYADAAGTGPVGSDENDDAALPFIVAPPHSICDNMVVFACSASAANAKKP
jgi:hypothetical protein